MLRFFKHQVSNYFANMGQIRIYNYLTNQLINQLTISEFDGLCPKLMMFQGGLITCD